MQELLLFVVSGLINLIIGAVLHKSILNAISHVLEWIKNDQ